MAVARYVLTLFAMVLGCKEPSDRHASGPGSIQPEPARSGHVHTAQGRVAIQARAELDTLLALNPDAAAGRVAAVNLGAPTMRRFPSTASEKPNALSGASSNAVILRSMTLSGSDTSYI